MLRINRKLMWSLCIFDLRHAVRFRSLYILFLSYIVKLGNYKASVLHFERALDRAKLMQDHSASEAIQKVNTDIPILLSHSLPHPSRSSFQNVLSVYVTEDQYGRFCQFDLKVRSHLPLFGKCLQVNSSHFN